MFVGDLEHALVASESCQTFTGDQSVHLKNTTALKCTKIQITRREKVLSGIGKNPV